MSDSEPASRRAFERRKLDLPAVCRAPASPHQVTVLDISYGGCRLRFDHLDVPRGSTVILDLRQAQLSGEIAWSAAGSSGVKFHRRLPSDTAVFVGLEEAPAPAAEDEPDRYDAPAAGLSHWVRRVLGVAAIGRVKRA